MVKVKNLTQLSKIFYHYKLRSRILPYMPVRAWLEPTNVCNLKCKVCPNSIDTVSPRGYMEYDLFCRIVDQLAGYVNDINLSHRGESLFHPDIFKMVRYCHERGIKTRIHSNATQLDAEKSRALIESGLDLLSFSFDGFDKKTYEETRINANFEQTLAKIIEYLETKQKLGTKKPFTIIQVIMQNNFPETLKEKTFFMKNFENLPLDRLYVKQAHNWGGNIDIKNCESCAAKKGKFSMCTFPWYAITILWNGIVVPCPQDWFGSLNMGDLNHKDVVTIWNDTPYFDIRTKMVLQNLQGVLCDTCDRPWRKQFLGVPVENATTFLKEHVLGYGSLKTR